MHFILFIILHKVGGMGGVEEVKHCGSMENLSTARLIKQPMLEGSSGYHLIKSIPAQSSDKLEMRSIFEVKSGCQGHIQQNFEHLLGYRCPGLSGHPLPLSQLFRISLVTTQAHYLPPLSMCISEKSLASSSLYFAINQLKMAVTCPSSLLFRLSTPIPLSFSFFITCSSPPSQWPSTGHTPVYQYLIMKAQIGQDTVDVVSQRTKQWGTITFLKPLARLA